MTNVHPSPTKERFSRQDRAAPWSDLGEHWSAWQNLIWESDRRCLHHGLVPDRRAQLRIDVTPDTNMEHNFLVGRANQRLTPPRPPHYRCWGSGGVPSVSGTGGGRPPARQGWAWAAKRTRMVPVSLAMGATAVASSPLRQANHRRIPMFLFSSSRIRVFIVTQVHAWSNSERPFPGGSSNDCRCGFPERPLHEGRPMDFGMPRATKKSPASCRPPMCPQAAAAAPLLFGCGASLAHEGGDAAGEFRGAAVVRGFLPEAPRERALDAAREAPLVWKVDLARVLGASATEDPHD